MMMGLMAYHNGTTISKWQHSSNRRVVAQGIRPLVTSDLNEMNIQQEKLNLTAGQFRAR